MIQIKFGKNNFTGRKFSKKDEKEIAEMIDRWFCDGEFIDSDIIISDYEIKVIQEKKVKKNGISTKNKK